MTSAALTLIVPGYLGSGPTHWQSHFERRVSGAARVSGIDWERPVLDNWARAVGQAVQNAARPVWLVAHSFGCLASVASGFGPWQEGLELFAALREGRAVLPSSTWRLRLPSVELRAIRPEAVAV